MGGEDLSRSLMNTKRIRFKISIFTQTKQMATNKKRIAVYSDWLANFEDLTDEELGKLMRHFFEYVNDKKPILEDRLLKIAWKPIEQTLKRDLIKWEETIEKRSKAGKMSALARNEQKQQVSTSVESVKKDLTKSTVRDKDSVNVSVSVKENVNVSVIKEKKEVFNFRKELLKLGTQSQFVEDWMKVRAKKKATNSQTALITFLNRVKESGKTLDEVLLICIEKNWISFNADWITNQPIRGQDQNNKLKLQPNDLKKFEL